MPPSARAREEIRSDEYDFLSACNILSDRQALVINVKKTPSTHLMAPSFVFTMIMG